MALTLALLAVFATFLSAIAPFFFPRVPSLQVRLSFLLLGIGGVTAAAGGAMALLARTTEDVVVPLGLPWLHVYLHLDPLAGFFLFVVGAVTSIAACYGPAYVGQLPGAAAQACQKEVARRFGRSMAVRMVDAGSCNGCELEMHAVNNGFYDIERFGIHFVASPRHADLLLVTGPVARHMQAALLRTYEATPDPKLVIAMGDCAAHGGEFGVSYASCGSVENVIPVDCVIPGCPPTPLQLLQGILHLLRQR